MQDRVNGLLIVQKRVKVTTPSVDRIGLMFLAPRGVQNLDEVTESCVLSIAIRSCVFQIVLTSLDPVCSKYD